MTQPRGQTAGPRMSGTYEPVEGDRVLYRREGWEGDVQSLLRAEYAWVPPLGDEDSYPRLVEIKDLEQVPS